MARGGSSLRELECSHISDRRYKLEFFVRGGKANDALLSEPQKATIMVSSPQYSVSIGADRGSGGSASSTPLRLNSHSSGRPPPLLAKSPPPQPLLMRATYCTRISRVMARHNYCNPISQPLSDLVSTQHRLCRVHEVSSHHTTVASRIMVLRGIRSLCIHHSLHCSVEAWRYALQEAPGGKKNSFRREQRS